MAWVQAHRLDLQLQFLCGGSSSRFLPTSGTDVIVAISHSMSCIQLRMSTAGRYDLATKILYNKRILQSAPASPRGGIPSDPRSLSIICSLHGRQDVDPRTSDLAGQLFSSTRALIEDVLKHVVRFQSIKDSGESFSQRRLRQTGSALSLP